MPAVSKYRIFKTARFDKDCRRARIADEELCVAVRQVMAGQADDLGGGVFKKRLNNNMHRSIILAKGGRHWVYQYLFAKKNRDNIDGDELLAFRSLAKAYASLSNEQINQLLSGEDILEICDDR